MSSNGDPANAGERPASAAPVRRVYRCGEECPSAKLTADQVREIRAIYARDPGPFARRPTYNQLGEAFGVSGVAIFKIVQGESWRHVAPVAA